MQEKTKELILGLQTFPFEERSLIKMEGKFMIEIRDVLLSLYEEKFGALLPDAPEPEIHVEHEVDTPSSDSEESTRWLT